MSGQSKHVFIPDRLEKELKTLRNPETAAKGNPRAVPLLACLSALLCEHGRFDDIRRAFPGKGSNFFAVRFKLTTIFL